MKNNENKRICSKCNGACCKRAPGFFYAGDFRKIDFDEKKMVIDRIERSKYSTIYFVRPRGERDDREYRFSRIWSKGPCVYLQKEGCALDFRRRPYQCKILDPVTCPDNKGYSRKKEDRNLIRSWRPWQDALFEYAYNGKEFPNVRNKEKLSQHALSGDLSSNRKTNHVSQKGGNQ